MCIHIYISRFIVVAKDTLPCEGIFRFYSQCDFSVLIIFLYILLDHLLHALLATQMYCPFPYFKEIPHCTLLIATNAHNLIDSTMQDHPHSMDGFLMDRMQGRKDRRLWHRTMNNNRMLQHSDSQQGSWRPTPSLCLHGSRTRQKRRGMSVTAL
jgi:hypothetical protein